MSLYVSLYHRYCGVLGSLLVLWILLIWLLVVCSCMCWDIQRPARKALELNYPNNINNVKCLLEPRSCFCLHVIKQEHATNSDACESLCYCTSTSLQYIKQSVYLWWSRSQLNAFITTFSLHYHAQHIANLACWLLENSLQSCEKIAWSQFSYVRAPSPPHMNQPVYRFC